jgi:opacity protein-like surface antigen
MLKKLLVATAIFSISSTAAFARHVYKDDAMDYKNEVPRPPCATARFGSGAYLGLSVGARTNYTRTPVVYKGLEGTLSLGYAEMLAPNFYLAGELFGGDSAQLVNYRDIASNGVRSTWSYGFDLIPGVLLTDSVLGYLRAGVVRTRFNNQGSNANAWQAGLGMQTNVAANWDLRLEYIYSIYRSVNLIGNPNSDQYNLGLVYKFM